MRSAIAQRDEREDEEESLNCSSDGVYVKWSLTDFDVIKRKPLWHHRDKWLRDGSGVFIFPIFQRAADGPPISIDVLQVHESKD